MVHLLVAEYGIQSDIVKEIIERTHILFILLFALQQFLVEQQQLQQNKNLVRKCWMHFIWYGVYGAWRTPVS